MTDRRGSDILGEALRERVHYQSLESSLSSTATLRVLRGAHAARLDTFLALYPLHSIGFPERSAEAINGKATTGTYNPFTRAIEVSRLRPRLTWGQPFVSGHSLSVSSGAVTLEDALSRSLVHEMGHHLHFYGGSEIEILARASFHDEQARPITRLAALNWMEYFCESHAAYVFEHSNFLECDPIGHAMIKAVRAHIGVPL